MKDMKPMKFFLQVLHALHGKKFGYFHIKIENGLFREIKQAKPEFSTCVLNIYTLLYVELIL